MYSFFTQSSSFYYTLITISVCTLAYIIIREIYLSYKKEKESIQNALKIATSNMSFQEEFKTEHSNNINNTDTIKTVQNTENIKEFNKDDAIIRKTETNTSTENKTNKDTKTTKDSLESLNRLSEISKLIKRADVLIGQKEYKEAEKILIQSLSYDETHRKSLELIAQVYLSLEQYSKAIFFLDNFFTYHKETVATCNNYALAHFYTKDFPVTISYYSKAIALEPNNALRYENLGKIFLALENFEDARKCYIEASKIDYKNIEYHKTIATCFKKETNYTEAKKWYEKILEFSPYDKETLQELEDLKKLGF